MSLSSGAYALDLLVVSNYDQAGSPELWKKAKTDQVPDALLANQSLSAPSSSYASLFPKTFLQNEFYAVCHKNCQDKEIFRLKNGEIDNKDKNNWDVIEQSNVYFWLNRYFGFLDSKLQFRPDKFLKVITNRELRDETKGKKMKNNAFFNPLDISLSFLPANKNLLFKLTGGKINRSGFDPSVVAHEASHYLFHHLFPNPVNDEIGGLNEGFADYIANVFLNNPKVGLVMMHGQVMRDSSNQIDKAGRLKMYEPGMEVHDLGERVAYALWKSRELSTDKSEMDRLVIDAIQDLGTNPYSTAHDFKEKMLERLSSVVESTNMINIRTIWEIAFTGSVNKIANLNFLNKPVSTKAFLGFRTKQVLPEALAREFGTKAVEESNLIIIRTESVSPTQVAILMATENEIVTTPYWIVIDIARNNVLGIFGLDKELVINEEELARIKPLADKAKGAVSFIKNFSSKVKSFTELSFGKGDFNVAYKVKNQSSISETIIFNGVPMAGHRHEMELKRRLLTGILFGMPEITGITLYSLPLPQIASMPDMNGEKVIGYKMQFKTGTAIEVVLDKHSLK
jgi:hypothetical protein